MTSRGERPLLPVSRDVALEPVGQDDGNRAVLFDVLRGIAVLSVMVLHTGTHGLSRSTSWYDTCLWPILSHGYLGVQLFFVISGYCIQGAVESARQHPQPLRTFLYRRARRIYPPYWWSLVLAIILAWGTISIMGKSWWSVFPLTMRDWLLNLILLQGPFGAPDATLVYWSLTIEVQFYVLMAIGLILGRWSAGWILGLSVAYLAWIIHPSVGISGTGLSYWPEFACGIAAYHAIHHGTFGRWIAGGLWLLTGLSAVAGLTHGQALINVDGELTTPLKQFFCLGCGGFLWATYRTSTALNRWPICRCVAAVGVMSYSLYLTHVPIGGRIFNLAGRFMDLDGPGWIGVAIVSLMAQFAFGVLFYRFCEAPWLNRREARVVLDADDSASHPQTVLRTKAVG